MREKVRLVLFLMLLVSESHGSRQEQEELLRNGDFEQPFSTDDWFCNGNCVLQTSTDAYTGQYSGYINSRTQPWNAIAQWIPMEPNSYYRFRAHVKILTLLPEYLWHFATMNFQLEMSDGSSGNQQFAQLPYNRPDWGWQEIGGDFIMDSRDVVRARLTITFQESMDIEYLVDAATLTKLPHDPAWRTKADARIEQIRKDHVSVNVQSGGTCDPALVQVQLDHFRHDFAFGSAVKAVLMSGTDPTDRKYQQTFLHNFNWAVLENSLKWKQMERVQGEIDFETSDNALDVLAAHNIPVRGHAIFWGKEANNPAWLLSGYEGEDMRDELRRRMDYVVTHYQGSLAHWDVNNEQCHGDWYEQKTADANITSWMFEEVAKLDADTVLFLNDFAVVRGGQRTVCFTNSAKMLLDQGFPVGGLGIQSHITSYPEIALYQDRLATVASAGLPIWITELDYEDADVERRADAYEDAVRLYFSTPEVEGVLLWGFWDQAQNKPLAALFEGPDLTPNAAGLRWQHLLNTEWSTHETLRPTSANEDFAFRGYYGNYTVRVTYGGALREEGFLYVSRAGENSLHIVLDDC